MWVGGGDVRGVGACAAEHPPPPPPGHTDFIYQPYDLRSLPVDVMVEAKSKEQAVLALQGKRTLPPRPAPPPSQDDES